MAQLKRTGPTTTVQGVGHTRRGVIHTVPDQMVKDLLATGEWEEVTPAEAPAVAEAERVTEPAPSKPASKPKTKARKK